MTNKYDLICATIDETPQLLEFLEHLNQQVEKNKNIFEIRLILIDQYKKDREEKIKKSLKNLIYIKSNELGLSKNRNKGIKISNAKFYSFIDADCRLKDDFFHELNNAIIEKPEQNLIYGKIKSIETDEDLFKKWPSKKTEINNIERWFYSTSVNIVYCGEKILFDEKLGIGAPFGSCEDIDYALRVKGSSIYTPSLIVYHPSQTFSDLPEKKIISYGEGYGALCRKHLSIISVSILIISIINKIITTFIKHRNFKKSLLSIKARITGFKKYHS